MSLGIVGGGVLGSAHARCFMHYCDVKVYDVAPERGSHEWREVVDQEVILVCLPTPMRRNGSANTDSIARTFHLLIDSGAKCSVVILKSTVPPRDLLKLDAIFAASPITFVYSPEFLTERTAAYDLQQSSHFVFGANVPPRTARDCVDALYEVRFPLRPRRWTTLATASLVKYFTNVFFATKVALFNEFAEIAEAFDCDPVLAIDLVMEDGRIGYSHFQVPGQDGSLGYGGACFLKDVPSYVHLARAEGMAAEIVAAGWRSNLRVRGLDEVRDELQSKLFDRAITETMSAEDVESLVR